MSHPYQDEFLSLLEEELSAHEIETIRITENEELPILRVILPLFEDNRGTILMDICIFDYPEKIRLVQIYSTLLTDLGEKRHALQSVLNGWNTVAAAGAYGIYEDEDQLFHKYNVISDTEEDVEDVADRTLIAALVASEEISIRLPEAYALVDDN